MLKPATPAEEYAEWFHNNVNNSADNIHDMLFAFKYIVEVDHNKLFSEFSGMFGWKISDEFKDQYGYPARKLSESAVVHTMRGDYTNSHAIVERNEFGVDAVFVGTNSKEDATWIALKFK